MKLTGHMVVPSGLREGHGSLHEVNWSHGRASGLREGHGSLREVNGSYCRASRFEGGALVPT